MLNRRCRFCGVTATLAALGLCASVTVAVRTDSRPGHIGGHLPHLRLRQGARGQRRSARRLRQPLECERLHDLHPGQYGGQEASNSSIAPPPIAWSATPWARARYSTDYYGGYYGAGWGYGYGRGCGSGWWLGLGLRRSLGATTKHASPWICSTPSRTSRSGTPAPARRVRAVRARRPCRKSTLATAAIFAKFPAVVPVRSPHRHRRPRRSPARRQLNRRFGESPGPTRQRTNSRWRRAARRARTRSSRPLSPSRVTASQSIEERGRE